MLVLGLPEEPRPEVGRSRAYGAFRLWRASRHSGHDTTVARTRETAASHCRARRGPHRASGHNSRRERAPHALAEDARLLRQVPDTADAGRRAAKWQRENQRILSEIIKGKNAAIAAFFCAFGSGLVVTQSGRAASEPSASRRAGMLKSSHNALQERSALAPARAAAAGHRIDDVDLARHPRAGGFARWVKRSFARPDEVP
jgi:hypothetical protein